MYQYGFVMEDGVKGMRILVMSPHPDDDVISMGGTLANLCQQGYEVASVQCISPPYMSDLLTLLNCCSLMSHLSCNPPYVRGSRLELCLLQSEHSLDLLLWCVLYAQQVHVAYQTSGCIAVHDHDALRHMDFMHSFAAASGGDAAQTSRTLKTLQTFVRNKKRGQVRHLFLRTPGCPVVFSNSDGDMLEL